jgi:hypothetical protein
VIKKIVVLTGSLVRLEVQGDAYRCAELHPETGNMSVSIFQHAKSVANFADVHAIWFDDSAQLIPPEREV